MLFANIQPKNILRLGFYWREGVFPLPVLYFGATGGNRTRTVFLPTDFKSVVSAYSTTVAYWWNLQDSNLLEKTLTEEGQPYSLRTEHLCHKCSLVLFFASFH